MDMIGLHVKRLLADLGEFSPRISAITMTSYVPVPVLSERLTSASNAQFLPSQFVQEALRHRGYSNPIEEYPVSALVDKLAIQPREGSVRGLCSHIRLLDGSKAQLPLLDFQCAVNNKNGAAIVEAMKIMGQKRGALVTSGNSYHYYGFEPMRPEEWRHFMAYNILLAPLIDTRYLAHCLLEEMACLRIDARPNQNSEPVVTAIFGQ